MIPLASLPDATRERLRQKRNRILDLLEEEERQAEILEAKRESEEREEILRKRKEEASKEKDKLQKARELQKKMGRALLQNMGKAKEKEEKEREAQRIQDEEADKRRSPSMKKKTVAFAETLEQDAKDVTDESSSKSDWGDLTPGRLRNSKRPTLMSRSLLDKHPMKMTVVERFPATGQPSHGKVTLQSQGLDSDDESEPDADDASATADLSGEEEEQVLEQDEIDFDFAQHQREIALEYYQKRGTIGQDAAAAMTNHSHTTEEDMVGLVLNWLILILILPSGCGYRSYPRAFKTRNISIPSKPLSFCLQCHYSKIFTVQLNFSRCISCTRIIYPHHSTCYQDG